ncbi:hypothetical protein [Pseudoalteromonas sp. BDTF-M6]|uniref:hypothetical protein n=1 Tax=Pseudoalteromonas sp. BDTF-M6 TaxID=2796132 RepID=UPI001BAF1881|nr:hypothetical protein [Pseudoalteromonas sp. BDTF-M6]MBS3797966.1 hypothetical protein [Pseudoalteromonas sp. BDTF-M6]
MKTAFLTLCTLTFSTSVYAEEQDVADMSDPLAIYTQVGGGATDKGVNFKLGKAYDTGDHATAAQFVVEAKGLLGDTLGWRSEHHTTQSLDSLRFRNFAVTLQSLRATQLDVNYNFRANLVADESADISYSLIQALPPMGAFNFYPLAGVGASVGKDERQSDGSIDDGYSLMGSYGLIGMYAKVNLSDKIWLNYNPFWLTTLTGSSTYKENYYGLNERNILTHEFAASYQITPRLNVRYFANWNENVDIFDGDHRIEFNYQL